MNATPSRTRPQPVVPRTDCGFPACEAAAVTLTGMCDAHRLVHVSHTGSWLEAS